MTISDRMMENITLMGYSNCGCSIALMGWYDCGCQDEKTKKHKGGLRIQPAQVQRIQHSTRIPLNITISQAHQILIPLRFRVMLSQLLFTCGVWEITTTHTLTAPLDLVQYTAESHAIEVGRFC